MADVYYTIDRQRRLTAVGGAWDAFAAANGAPELLGHAVLGRPLLDFVTGSEMKNIYDLLFQRVDAGHTIAVWFRCDAPAERRYMRLTASPGTNEGIEFRVETTGIEPRSPQPILDRGHLRDLDWVTVCSWCKRLLLDGSWVDVEEAVEPLDLFGRERLPQLTHGLCASCTDRIRAQWEGA